MGLLVGLLGGVSMLAAFLLLAGVVYQAIGSATDAWRFPPPGQMVDVGGHRLHVYCTGEGSPTVVMDSGLPGSSLSWTFVQSKLAEFTGVCSYDRAGLGWSDRGPTPRTSLQIVEELHALLKNAKIQPPYVLVGHSFGGFTVRLYASKYPEEVVGMVLVDSIHPGEWLQMKPEQERGVKAGVRLARRTAMFARLGLMRFYFFLLGSGVLKARARSDWIASLKKLPRELLPVMRAFWSQPKAYEAIASQVEFLPQSARQVAAGSGHGDIPLVVLSASSSSSDQLMEQQTAMRLSSQAKHVFASSSGHWIQLDQPDLVVEAIREVVESARHCQLGKRAAAKSYRSER